LNWELAHAAGVFRHDLARAADRTRQVRGVRPGEPVWPVLAAVLIETVFDRRGGFRDDKRQCVEQRVDLLMGIRDPRRSANGSRKRGMDVISCVRAESVDLVVTEAE